MKSIEKIFRYIPVPYESLPEIPLYMDQVIGYLNEKFSDLLIEDVSKPLTKTMINNYVKAGIIDKPIDKKYHRKHLAQIIMLYQLKNVLSIDDIKKMLTEIEDENSVELYKEYVQIHHEVSQHLSNEYEGEVSEEEELKRLVSWSIECDLKKRYVENRMIEISQQHKKSPE